MPKGLRPEGAGLGLKPKSVGMRRCRSAEEMFLSVGGRIGYFQGDPRKLVDDIAELRPTIFVGAQLASALLVTAPQL